MMKLVNLSEVARIDWGNTSLTKKSYQSEGDFLGVSAAGCDGRMSQAEQSVGTLVLSAIGANCGKMFYPDEPFTAIKNTIVIEPNSDIDSKYLFYFLNTNQILSRGAGQPFITKGDTSKKKIPLPPLEEQQKIAAILDAADDYRQKTKALIDKYDQLTQSLFLDMFGDSTNTERTELANTVTDKGHFVDGPFGSNLKVSDQTEKGIRLIQVNNIRVRVFRDKTSRFTSVEKYETLRKHEVIPGDLVVAKMGEPLGRCCILPNHISKALVVADCMRIRVSSPHFISKYVMFFLNSYDAKQQIKNLSRGSTRVRINLSMLRKLKIPKPTLSSQNQFAERVAQIEQQKQQAEASLVKAEELFSSLLQRAFKGELTS